MLARLMGHSIPFEIELDYFSDATEANLDVRIDPSEKKRMRSEMLTSQ